MLKILGVQCNGLGSAHPCGSGNATTSGCGLDGKSAAKSEEQNFGKRCSGLRAIGAGLVLVRRGWGGVWIVGIFGLLGALFFLGGGELEAAKEGWMSRKNDVRMSEWRS